MNGETIKSFLVGLGFGVDETSLAKFNKSIQSAALRVTALYTTINAAATGIVAGIANVSEGFEKMGYEYRIIAPAINKALILRRELLKAYSAAGINITKVVQQSVKLNFSLDKTKFAFEAIYKSVAAKFFPLITKQSDIFRKKLYENMPKIQAGLEKFVKFIFKAFEAVTELGVRLWSILTRVYDFFVALDKATNGWSTIIAGVVAAWYALNLAFLATPLGQIIAGLTAILALYDDFKTFQEGGQSLLDWSKFLPIIDAVTVALSAMRKVLDEIFQTLFAVGDAIYQLFTKGFGGFIDRMKEAFNSLLAVAQNTWGFLKTIPGIGSAIANVASNAASAGAGSLLAAPVGAQSAANSQTNQHVQQQTTINVQGSADANSVGKSVAGEQTRVNFDMVRNMKGATR